MGYRGETALSRTALSRDLSESAESGGVGLELRSTEKWLFIPVVDPDPLLLALKTRFLHAGTPAIQRKGRLSCCILGFANQPVGHLTYITHLVVCISAFGKILIQHLIGHPPFWLYVTGDADRPTAFIPHSIPALGRLVSVLPDHCSCDSDPLTNMCAEPHSPSVIHDTQPL